MADEFGSYIEGRGYVPAKRKPRKKPVLAPSESGETVKSHAEIYGNPVQQVLTRVFGTVPRNRLKEAGLE